jgi:D-beta-D-heptose 7-phosphate kinase/D-beta-D-heptose 1-phosphate adenosyltransferase
VVVDPKSKSLRKYQGASVLTPNRLELQLACGHECATDEQVNAGAEAILGQKICDALVVTRGKDGMTVAEAPQSADTASACVHIRTAAREVFDVSGAGDTVVATLALGLAFGATLVDAARLANTAAGIVVGKHGTATVSAGEIIARLDPAHDGPLSGKHFALESVQQLVARWRDLGLRIAFTNGCFDLLHPGHVALLNQARRSADRLVVGLNSDLSVGRLKGAGRPIQGEVARATVLASLKSVDAVVIFPEDTPLELITALEPDVLVKGADYTIETVVGAEVVLRRGGKVLLADLVPSHSTTNTIERISAVAKA